jgi:hypothetical protein
MAIFAEWRDAILSEATGNDVTSESKRLIEDSAQSRGPVWNDLVMASIPSADEPKPSGALSRHRDVLFPSAAKPLLPYPHHVPAHLARPVFVS